MCTVRSCTLLMSQNYAVKNGITYKILTIVHLNAVVFAHACKCELTEQN